MDLKEKYVILRNWMDAGQCVGYCKRIVFLRFPKAMKFITFEMPIDLIAASLIPSLPEDG